MLRVLEQRQHAIANQIDGRLVSRDNQQEDGRDEFGLAEGIPAVLYLNQATHEVTARLLAFLGQQRFDILDKLLQHGVRLLRLWSGSPCDDRL